MPIPMPTKALCNNLRYNLLLALPVLGPIIGLIYYISILRDHTIVNPIQQVVILTVAEMIWLLCTAGWVVFMSHDRATTTHLMKNSVVAPLVIMAQFCGFNPCRWMHRRSFETSKQLLLSSTGADCAICQMAMLTGEEECEDDFLGTVLLPCGHTYHAECVKELESMQLAQFRDTKRRQLLRFCAKCKQCETPYCSFEKCNYADCVSLFS